MPLLVVGSVGIDTVETPSGQASEVLGGAATYFAYAASFFTPVRLVAAVGGDFPQEFRNLLEARGVDISGLEVIAERKTFRWRGRYSADLNQRQTLEVQLNVMADFNPTLPEPLRRCPFVFLANGSPRTQLATLDQLQKPQLVVADTMDLWIESELDALMKLLGRIDGLVINDQEARLLAGTENLVRAAQAILMMGPSFLVLKKGEHGAMFFGPEQTCVLPAYPTPDVVDPTGAGDTFAAGFLGQMASAGKSDAQTTKLAVAYGIVTASFTVEDFSLDRLARIKRADIEQRLDEYREMTRF